MAKRKEQGEWTMNMGTTYFIDGKPNSNTQTGKKIEKVHLWHS